MGVQTTSLNPLPDVPGRDRTDTVIAACLDGLAAIAVRHDKTTDAADLLAVADKLRESVGAVAEPLELQLHERTRALLTSKLGLQQLEFAHARVETIAIDDAILHALALVRPAKS